MKLSGIARFLVRAGIVPLLTIFSFGQTQASSTAAEKTVLDASVPAAATFQIKVNEVDLSFTARDRHNHWVTNLSASDISVLDNGQPPKAILSFQSRADLPLRVGLVIDTSDSVTRQFEAERQSAIFFIQQV